MGLILWCKDIELYREHLEAVFEKGKIRFGIGIGTTVKLVD